MQRKTTLFLRLAIWLMGLMATALFGLEAWIMLVGLIRGGSQLRLVRMAVGLGTCGAAVCFWGTLIQALKLLGYIDKGNAFSEVSVTALKKIKQWAMGVGMIFTVVGLPYLYYLADIGDAPGLVVIGLVLTCVPYIISVFAALLQRLLREAVQMKVENELTI